MGGGAGKVDGVSSSGGGGRKVQPEPPPPPRNEMPGMNFTFAAYFYRF